MKRMMIQKIDTYFYENTSCGIKVDILTLTKNNNNINLSDDKKIKKKIKHRL